MRQQLQKGLMQTVILRNLEEAEDSLAGASCINGFVNGLIIKEKDYFKVQTVWSIDSEPLIGQRVAYWLAPCG